MSGRSEDLRPRGIRNLSLRSATGAELIQLSEVSRSDQERIASRFRATTAREDRDLLDAQEVKPVT